MSKNFIVDENTYATNPGNANLDFLTWAKYNLFHTACLIFPLVSLFFTVLFDGFGNLLFFIPVLLLNIYYWRLKKEHFKRGDSNPGKVIAVKPTMVAVATNMTKGFGNYPVVKVIKYKSNKMEIGQIIPTVALYGEARDESIPHWIEFNPIPLRYATSNPVDLQGALDSYEPEQLERLDQGIAQLPSEYQKGLYKVNIEDSDWKDLPNSPLT